MRTRLIAIGGALLVLTACASASPSSTEGDDTAPDGLVATDATGTEIRVDSPAERIVCLDGSCIDALHEVGITPVAVSNSSMATHEDYFGADAEIDAIAGSFFEPDIEEIIGADPDLVIATFGVHADIVDAVGTDTPVYLQSIPDLDAARAFVHDVGTLTGREQEAAAAVDAFDVKLDAYASAVSGDRVPLSLYGSDLDFGIDAANSIVGLVLAEVTAYPWPAADDGSSGFLDFSVERVLEVDPDAIYVQTFEFDGATAPLSEQLADNPLWSELKAVQTGDIYEVDSSYWASGRATRTLGLVLDVVIPTLYPDDVPEPLG